jgi:uroporphyrinogen decarboxylase
MTFGNPDSSIVFNQGTPEEVTVKTHALLKRMSGYRNFVLSSGCDIPPGTPATNIDAFFTALEEWQPSRS